MLSTSSLVAAAPLTDRALVSHNLQVCNASMSLYEQVVNSKILVGAIRPDAQSGPNGYPRL